jgi:hypothetical protein
MDTYARGLEIVTELEALGVRAYMDPALASPPCLLVIPPNLRFDLQCDSVTALWQMVALVPAANTADRTTWQGLQNIINAAQKVLDLEAAELVSYVVNGKTFPAYLLTCQEGI